MSRRKNRNPNVPPKGWARDVAAWGEKNGVAVSIKNHGEHLICEAPGLRCEWWPSTAKTVFDRRFKHASTERDHRRVMLAIERRLPRVKQQASAQRPAADRPCFLDFAEDFRAADLGYLDALVMGAI